VNNTQPERAAAEESVRSRATRNEYRPLAAVPTVPAVTPSLLPVFHAADAARHTTVSESRRALSATPSPDAAAATPDFVSSLLPPAAHQTAHSEGRDGIRSSGVISRSTARRHAVTPLMPDGTNRLLRPSERYARPPECYLGCRRLLFHRRPRPPAAMQSIPPALDACAPSLVRAP